MYMSHVQFCMFVTLYKVLICCVEAVMEMCGFTICGPNLRIFDSGMSRKICGFAI
jgi:hypothetical protein